MRLGVLTLTYYSRMRIEPGEDCLCLFCSRHIRQTRKLDSIALLVSEILLEAFMHVNKSLGPHAPISSCCEMSLARKSFAALAWTCKPFYEPAMDLLWAELDGIEPLLGCVARLHPIMYRSGGSRVSADYVHYISFICSPSTQTQCSVWKSLNHCLGVEPINSCITPLAFAH
jgi:hypothetical protein